MRPALSGVRRLLRPPAGTGRGFRRVAMVLVAFGVVNVPDALLLLHLHQIGFGVAGVILAYVGYNAVYAVASYPAGALADRVGPRRVFGLGLVFFAIGFAGLGLTRSAWLSCVLLAAYGVFAACTDGPGRAWVSRHAGALRQGAGQGFVQGMNGFAVLGAGLWAGLLWGADGRVPLLVAGTAGGLLALALLTPAHRLLR